MRVSVIATVFNEGESLRTLLDSLALQSRPPDELVIADAGSTDNTVDILREYAEGKLPLQLIPAPGSNISQGRNMAIRAAAGPIIAATDAGVRLEPQWLERLVAPIKAGHSTAAGFFQPDPQNAFEIALGATVLPAVEDINPGKFLPSSRSVAFLKESWEAVGGYPEWLDYCEDLLYDFALIEQHGPFPFVPEAVARFRPRNSLASYFVQYYRYARGDGKADLWRKRHALRYATYLLGLPLIAWLGLAVSPWLWLWYLLGAATYLYRPLQRIRPALATLSGTDKLLALAAIPIIRVVGDVAKMIGYPAGIWWRWTSGQAQKWR